MVNEPRDEVVKQLSVGVRLIQCAGRRGVVINDDTVVVESDDRVGEVVDEGVTRQRRHRQRLVLEQYPADEHRVERERYRREVDGRVRRVAEIIQHSDEYRKAGSDNDRRCLSPIDVLRPEQELNQECVSEQ